jgi:hypothetical protein
MQKPFSESHPHLADFQAFLDDFNRETERGAALAAAAMIDSLLERVLLAFLIENAGLKSPFEGVLSRQVASIDFRLTCRRV